MSGPGREGLLLALDLGTATAKAGLFRPDGTLLRAARHAYPLDGPHPDGRAEQDPERWWAAVRDGIREVLAAGGAARDAIRATCVFGQGPTLVLVDGGGRPVRAALSWLDTRAAGMANDLARRTGEGRLAYALLPRLAWLAAHEPAALDRARWALQAWDFVGCRLAGGRVGVASTHAGDRVWPRAWLEAAGLAGDPRLPRHVDAGTAYAQTDGPWAAEAGLPAGIPIVGGLNDGLGAILGADGSVVGRATDPGGASGGLGLCWDTPLSAPGVDCWPGLSAGTYIVGGAFAAGGRALDWWAAASATDVPGALERAAQAPAGAGGVVFLPFLAGERAPLWDARARGAFVGLGFGHTGAHLARAVVESAGFALRLLLDAVVAAGGRVDELRVCGRQAESRLWNQVKADVTGCPVVVPRVVEVSLMGSAVCAAVGGGCYPDLASATRAMVQVAHRLDPAPSTRAVYAARYATYQAAARAVRGLRAGD